MKCHMLIGAPQEMMDRNQISKERAHSTQLAKTDQFLNMIFSQNKYQNLSHVFSNFPGAFHIDDSIQGALIDHQHWIRPCAGSWKYNTTQSWAHSLTGKIKDSTTVWEEGMVRSEQNAEEAQRGEPFSACVWACPHPAVTRVEMVLHCVSFCDLRAWKSASRTATQKCLSQHLATARNPHVMGFR